MLMLRCRCRPLYVYLSGRYRRCCSRCLFFFQAEDGIRDIGVTWSSDVCSSDLVHEPLTAFFTHFVRKRAGQFVRFRALHRRIRKTADAVELGFLDKVEQLPELVFGLARKAGDEGAADRDIRADAAPGADAPEIVLSACRTL